MPGVLSVSEMMLSVLSCTIVSDSCISVSSGVPDKSNGGSSITISDWPVG